ncbi:hypothetical protein [Planctomyces sp. SH-PL14]|uniref:hypothetical protein n=1 Tax=Planctomyces sp. SH-PL14 TaxID=1632864 RepID=UPI00078CFE8F|nr:hypothetical protein [Planctomyces sp. SH-PL14]AMV21814.1 hypothetical protein VT03_28185 [Planctomyces sp. SH-PL14]
MRRITLFELEWLWLKWLLAEPLPLVDFVDLFPEHRDAIHGLREQGLICFDSDHVVLTVRGHRAVRTAPVPGPNGARVLWDLDPEEWVGREGLLPRSEPPA